MKMSSVQPWEAERRPRLLQGSLRELDHFPVRAEAVRTVLRSMSERMPIALTNDRLLEVVLPCPPILGLGRGECPLGRVHQVFQKSNRPAEIVLGDGMAMASGEVCRIFAFPPCRFC